MSNSNRITRESMDSIIEEIMGVSDCDWLSEDSKPREIERILVDAGIVEVIEAPVEGSGKSASGALTALYAYYQAKDDMKTIMPQKFDLKIQ